MHEKNQDLHRDRVHKHKEDASVGTNCNCFDRLFLYLRRDTTKEDLFNAQTNFVMVRNVLSYLLN